MPISLDEKINNHASYTNTINVLKILDEIDFPDLSAQDVQMLGRISSTFDFLKEALDKVDPWLVSTGIMNNLNGPISHVLSEITNYMNNRNGRHLVNALNHLETLLQYFPHLLIAKTPSEIEGVRNSVISFRKSIGQHLSNIEKTATETSEVLSKNTEKFNELTSAINDQKTRVDSVVNELQNQFLQGQAQRNNGFNNFIDQGEEDYKGIISEIEVTFEQQMETLQNSFDSVTEGYEKQIETQQNAFDLLIQEFKATIQTELDQIHTMNKDAEKILGLMSMKGLAQGYQKIANSEANKALGWNAISLLSMIGVLWFGYQFIIINEGVMTWITLVSRIVMTGVGLTLFTYGAKQATSHRIEERRNRKIELELASLDPYLKDLEPAEQKAVKQSLVDKYFGVDFSNTPIQQGQTSLHQNTIDSINNNPQLLKLLAEKVTELISKK
ncbi:hypothetical protein [Sporosarcina sp. FA9]|uniref:hypothetical protein n=1 Tax=Sporosarcina sp. FA9 TaxID=3413030 RepID=UPI003F660B87